MKIAGYGKSLRILILSFISGLQIIGGLPLFAVQDSQSIYGVRELCRIAVSGEYLERYDRYVAQENQQLILEEKIKNLTTALTKQRQMTSTAEKNFNNNDFDTKAAKELEDAKAKLELLSTTFEESQKLLADTRVRILSDRKSFKDLQSIALKVFKVLETKKSKSKNNEIVRPLSLVYISTCPKFQPLCPLPSSDARDLEQIVSLMDHPPESCRRYLSYTAELKPKQSSKQ